MSEDVQVVKDDFETLNVICHDDPEGAITVELYRPGSRNALNAAIRSDLKDLLDVVEADRSVKVVVITGSDEGKAFAAGADVHELRDRDEIEQRIASKRPRIFERVEDLSKPVIARVNGHALGGGCELTLACDLRLGHERAKLGFPEINLGIIPGGGATQRLPRLVGEGEAMHLVLTGELVDAMTAAEIGLIDEVFEDVEALDARTYELAEMMAKKSPLALELGKKAVQAGSRMNLKEGIEYEVELFLHLFGTADKDEGIDAFFEEREPEWEGR